VTRSIRTVTTGYGWGHSISEDQPEWPTDPPEAIRPVRLEVPVLDCLDAGHGGELGAPACNPDLFSDALINTHMTCTVFFFYPIGRGAKAVGWPPGRN